MAPALTLYFWNMHQMKSFGWFAAMVFAIAMALRLARFNAGLDDPDRPAWASNFFTGMPAPAGAITEFNFDGGTLRSSLDNANFFPAALTTAGNAGLYRDAGIRLAAAALRPGGRLAYWAAEPDPAFERALRHAGLVVEEERVRAHAAGGPRHALYLARAR